MGHAVSHRTVASLLAEAGYSLQGNRKTKEGGTHPDRDAQFRHVAARVADARAKGQPAVSVDAKKKELVGEFRNGGREWRPEGEPEEVKVYDFVDPAPDKGRVTPYGVYDLAANEAWVSVGTDHDTARFAAGTIRKWWDEMGRGRYPAATELTITADGGGSNGSRCRLWTVALQDVADATGLTLRVCHLPPGTSKWNKIEHRLFCHVTQNWRGRPLVSHEVVVGLIGGTTTDGQGSQGQGRAGHGHLPDGREGDQAGDGRGQHRAGRVPRRVELHHLATPDVNDHFISARLLSGVPKGRMSATGMRRFSGGVWTASDAQTLGPLEPTRPPRLGRPGHAAAALIREAASGRPQQWWATSCVRAAVGGLPHGAADRVKTSNLDRRSHRSPLSLYRLCSGCTSNRPQARSQRPGFAFIMPELHGLHRRSQTSA